MPAGLTVSLPSVFFHVAKLISDPFRLPKFRGPE